MSAKLRAGDLVEVRSKEEILATLDSKGRLKGMPFMPEMFQHCGKQFRVYKRAHKTCDTVNQTGGRRVGDAVHLEGIRCGGEAHGGCQAACLIFWWRDWLRKVGGANASSVSRLAPEPLGAAVTPKAGGCSEQDVVAAAVTSESGAADAVYSCQATLLPQYTKYLPWWDIRQYVEDYRSGNVGLWTIFCGFIYAWVYRLSRLRGGRRILKVPYFYDKFQSMVGGIKYPRHRGRIPLGEKTPNSSLGLKPGELVRVKAYEDILITLNEHNKNHGMYFDAEMVPFCGGTHRVIQRVAKIIDEKTGKMLHFKNESVTLDSVCCQARYSDRRMFCPRAIYPFWRDVWLERVEDRPAGSQ